MRNSLGQEIKIGSPVVVVTQSQGFANIDFGRVHKVSNKGYPIVKYHNGSMGAPLQRYERLFVMTEDQYEELKETQEILAGCKEEWWVNAGHSPGRRSKDWNDYKDYVNAAMNAAGKEDYYE